MKHINQLVGDYRRPERPHGGLGLGLEQRKALSTLQSGVDRSWGLLRLRRACRHVGAHPDMVLAACGGSKEGKL